MWRDAIVRPRSARRRALFKGGAGSGARVAGLTLIELLVATCVTAIALGGAWPWLWNAGATSRAMVARAQASTSAAFAARAIADDLELATAILPPPDGRSPSHALCLRHDHEGVEPETVLVAWDAARRVLWRKASGTYLADHVDEFTVTYYGADGMALDEAAFAEPGWTTSVTHVSFVVRTSLGGFVASACRDCVLGPA